MRRYPWHYALFLVAYYMANAVYQGFITVYFKDVGLSTLQIGALMSAVPIVSILTQPLWGALGDRAKSRNNVLRIMAAGAAGSVLLFALNHSFWYLMPLICVFSAFYTALQPMGDSVILEALQKDQLAFGPTRLCGSLAFAIWSSVTGALIQDQTGRVLFLTAALLGCTFFATFALPKTPGHQKKSEKTSMLTLFKQPHLAALLSLVTLLQMTMGYFYSFFPVHFTALPGGSSTLLGYAYLISALSEMPFLIFSDKLFQKLGAGKLLLIAAAALTARWLILAMVGNVAVVMASQVLHGWGFIVMTVSMSKYISLTVPEALRARGQMLLSIMGFGFARVAGNMGGGLIGNALGLQNGFFVSALVSGLALLCFTPLYLKKPALNG